MSKKKPYWKIKRGYALPLGATVLSEGVNFSLFSRHGSAVTLVIDCQPAGISSQRHEIILHPEENRTGDVWHILLAGIDDDITYGYRVSGPDGDEGYFFDPEKILIDPHCHALHPRKWGARAEYGKSPCCRLITHEFDWKSDRPLKTPLSETVIYELHIRGFSKNAGPECSAPGTYAGLVEKIPYLKKLGITAVELMPVTEFDENDNIYHDPDTSQKLKNFWGYNPVSFFALKSGYAYDPSNHINEFKNMVLALHQAGIEVFLDIVYNHTGEGGYDGNTSSFRGIDNPIYYLLDQEDHSYLNFSGCGNTFNCNHPIARSLIRDSLRYWVTEMHVDGFRFDLASILGRDTEGNVQANPPMIELIAEDPVLRNIKIIAEAWDAAGLYQVGSFSTDARWGEWNGRFRDDVRAFMAGHDDTVTKLATRIAGSSDLYQSSCRTPLSSINLITSHDGFTLYDLVSYNQKHNLNNGEDNRDGDNHNLSWNSGHEGSPAPDATRQLRLRRIRSMFTILMLSQGVPMLTAGDEFGRSQSGNNNAWCQDNPISWLDWSLVERNSDLHRFFQLCLALRKNHRVFRREEFFRSEQVDENEGGTEEISWQYLTPGRQNWAKDCHGLGVLLHGAAVSGSRDDDFFILINGHIHRKLCFTLPPVPQNGEDRRWHRIIDTAAKSPEDIQSPGQPPTAITEDTLTVSPLTVIVLRSLPVKSGEEAPKNAQSALHYHTG